MAFKVRFVNPDKNYQMIKTGEAMLADVPCPRPGMDTF